MHFDMGPRMLVLAVFCLIAVRGAVINWIDDSINVTSSTWRVSPLQRTYFGVHAIANGVIFPEQAGHYRLKVSYTSANGFDYIAHTECIDLSWPAEHVDALLKPTQFYQLFSTTGSSAVKIDKEPAFPLSKLYLTDVKRFFHNYTSEHRTFDTTFEIMFGRRKNVTEALEVSLDSTGCTRPRTIGLWGDATRWSSGTVPTSADTVRIHAGAGVIRISENVTLAALHMAGGQILNYDTYCPHGWSAEPEGRFGSKCYKRFDEPRTFAEAERVCNGGAGFGSETRHLIHIRDRAELLTATRLCRGYRGSAAHAKGCWIGLQDPSGTGDWRWLSALAVGTAERGTFLDWRRGEPNNHSISEGVPAGRPSAGGERCASLVPWQEDPLLQEQGSWNDISCETTKPFLCQVFGSTERYTLTVRGHAELTGGWLEGGLVVLGTAAGAVSLHGVRVSRSGRLVVAGGAADCLIGDVQLVDGATLQVLSATARTLSDAIIGEPQYGSATEVPLQPFLRVGANTTLTSQPVCSAPGHPSCMGSAVTIRARVFIEGTLVIRGATDVIMHQGGELSHATVRVIDEGSRLHLAGYSARLAAYDTYEVQVRNRGEVIGEFYRDLAAEERNLHQQHRQGVYRLKVASSRSSSLSGVTQCIPYNATAAELKAALDQVPLVRDRGGTTVRRYGSPIDPAFHFGYTYNIQMDSVATAAYADGPLRVTAHCYGFDGGCGCAETKVVLTDVTGIPQCIAGHDGRSSLNDPNSCVFPPNITVAALSRLSHTKPSGSGLIEVAEGVHRLPPVSDCTLAVSAGVGVVASDVVEWSGFSVTGAGRLVVAGTSWNAWDSSYALYEPEWFTIRGRVAALDSAPPVAMAVGRFYLAGLGAVLSSCPNSTLTWMSGTWAGGIIGGRSTLLLSSDMLAIGSGKSLRYGMTMVVQTTAVLNWNAGNISLGDGANIVVEGRLVVNTVDKEVPVFIGMAQLLEAPPSDAAAQALLVQEAGRSYHSYFGDELPPELRGGWYVNPLCGDRCGDTNHLIVRGDGVVQVTDQTAFTLSLPLDLVDRSKLNIGSNVTLTLASGGVCGNDVVVDISSGTQLELSGGQMLLDKTCTIQGEGELLVTAGSHDLSFSIDAHITIQGGSMVWPLSRGTNGVISFNGGLLMTNTGELQVNPFSTTIVIKKEVHLKDQSLIQFPLIGIAAQASLFDEQDAPDSSPRGNMVVEGVMRWDGGTLRGKADFQALDALFLDGGPKYIKSLAKLVNKGHCEWGSGDLISSDSGDFLNLGTVQMKDGARSFSSNAMYQGTELPIESGGDVFALNYHSWDMDNGGLDYTKYVQERTKFVSRAPNGWTVASQG